MANPATQSSGKDVSESSRRKVLCVSSMGLQGWLGFAIWMTFGLLLEGLLGYKIPAYLADPQRRELFRLAHSHGTLLSLLLVLAALWIGRGHAVPNRAVCVSLRLGTILLPVGFLLAGIWHFESDPGFAIWLVPLGAVMVIFAVIALFVSSRRTIPSTENSD